MSDEEFQDITPLIHQFVPAFIGTRLVFRGYRRDKLNSFIINKLLPALHDLRIRGLVFNGNYRDGVSSSFVIDKLLPTLHHLQIRVRHYDFPSYVRLEDDASFLISFLQHPSIVNASKINIQFFYADSSTYYLTEPEEHYPIDAISNWLHRPVVVSCCDSVELVNKRNYWAMEKRSLQVLFPSAKRINLLEMVDHLKKVHAFEFLALMFLTLNFLLNQITKRGIYFYSNG